MYHSIATLSPPRQQPVIPSDEELVSRARGGERHAFRLLVERHEQSVAATVVSMLGPSDDVDDVTQEVFIRFYDSLARFRGESSVNTYLKRIAINRSLDVLRRRTRLLSRFQTLDTEETPVSDNNTGGEVNMEKNERAAFVQHAISSLPPKHRAVVVLRLIDGYSTEETAQILNIAYGTVLSRLSRAHEKLKTMLAPYIIDKASDAEDT